MDPQGPQKFREKRKSMKVGAEQILHYPRAQSEVVVAVPPSSRKLIAPLFADLRDSGASWAVWSVEGLAGLVFH